MTAILLLALAIGVLMPGRTDETRLAAVLIEHVQRAPAALEGSAEVPVARVVDAVERGGGRLIGPLGKVTHAGPCQVPGGQCQHLVIETARGKATLFLLPGQPLEVRAELTRDGLTGVVLPAGSGSAGIVTGSGQALQEVEAAVRRRIAWN
jgi:hypothetical protein